ncbi:hypothetical protein FG062_12305 [Vibrio cholerae]|uniref:lipid II flippase MurJ n=1 Tax=Vibrio cincinnatiensis TaxID=675 RepID=UPI001EB6725B|nr:lipid II flippase MurJ [Vibrio cincinnatiensis]EGR0524529.1 hypothetical protein [Vibrio cholerae]EGR0600397.1 hypothetical protein [Vibrio cholerae]MCG3733170.1 hypothetical protein [Vibrio cincinnatiensis]
MKKIIKAKGPLFFFSGSLVITNFFTTLIIARSLGFGLELDLYYIALSVYLFLLAAIGWSLTNVITPILIKEGVDNTLAKIFYVLFVWSILIFLILFLFSPLLVKLIFNNYLDDYSTSSIRMLFFLSCSVFFVDLLAQVFVCFENASERYVRAVFINFLSSIAGLVFANYLVEHFGIFGAMSVQLIMKLLLFSILLFLNFKFLTYFEYDKKIAFQLYSKAKYFFVSGFYYRTEDLVEKYIASYLAPGYLSLVSFVQRIYGAVITVVNTSVITPTLTRFCNSNNIGQRNSDYKLMKLVSSLIVILSIISFPIIYFFGNEFLSVLFRDKLASVEGSVTFVLISLFPTVLLLIINQLLHNFLLSRSQEKKIAVFDMISYTLSLLAKVFLTYKFGLFGFVLGILFTSLLKLCFKLLIVIKVVNSEKALG